MFAEMHVKKSILTVVFMALGAEQAACHEPQSLLLETGVEVIWGSPISASAL